MNRTIWMYWQQGYEAAPRLVKLCVDSWRVRNPGWEVLCLDGETVREYHDLSRELDLERPDIPVQKVSALTRLALLERHGGVWADATVFCARPLDEWLPARMTEGFFAFQRPAPGRLMANWFMAAEPGNLLVRELRRELLDLFRNNRFTNQDTRFGSAVIRYLHPLLRRRVAWTRYWLSSPVVKILKVYPYYIFHYAFNKIVHDDPACAKIWRNVPRLGAKQPMAVHSGWKRNHPPEEVIERMVADPAPVYKLNWRVDLEERYWSAVLTHLLKDETSGGAPAGFPASPTPANMDT